MNDIEALKEWAWAWAQTLVADISRTQEWLDAVRAQASAGADDEQRAALETACIRATTAYFEYLRGNWFRERAEQEMADIPDWTREIL